MDKNVNTLCTFKFGDTQEVMYVWVRYGVAEVTPSEPLTSIAVSPEVRLTVSTTLPSWKGIVGGWHSVSFAMAGGNFTVDGGLGAFSTFFSLFDRQ